MKSEKYSDNSASTYDLNSIWEHLNLKRENHDNRFFSVIVIFAVLWSWGNTEKLLLATLFFAPFSSSVVIKIGDTFLQPGHALLLILILSILVKGKVCLRKPDYFLTAFVVWCLISILIAAVFGFNVRVYGIGNGVSLTSSKVSLQSFTQYIYLICGFLLYWFTFSYSSACEENQKKVIKTISLSTSIILLICIYQYIASIFGLPYDTIFRNTVDTWQSIDRLQGVMPEASLLAQHGILAIPIAVLFYEKKKISMIVFGCIILFIGVYSRSSTFLIGLIALLVMYVLTSRKTMKNLLLCVAIVLLAVLGCWFAYKYIPMFTRVVDLTISKYNQTTSSGIQRASVSSYMFNIWLQYPISGVGYGCGRSLNLYTNLLATTGIIGFGLFCIPICKWTIYSFVQRKEKTMMAIFLLLVGYWVTSIAIPDITYLNVWVFFGLASSFVRKKGLRFSLHEPNFKMIE